ncbi:uncharacterized protein VTP21DRAFT_4076 [Calcarisporiella thermophila]|uniref:uncharacterized protein n=1 Tax=Calcarisporiella thermophila TaxID=911321 RepID=UPI0037436285
MSQSETQSKYQARLLIEYLHALGFIVNEKKIRIGAEEQQVFLELDINTKSLDIKLPKEKSHELDKAYVCKDKAEDNETSSITSRSPSIDTETSIHFSWTFTKRPRKHFHRANQGWKKVVPLSKETIEDLKKWEILLDVHNGLHVRIPPPNETVTTTTEASRTGWGIVSTHLTTHCQLTDPERKTPSNHKELRAILFALKLHVKHWENKHIRIKTHKTAVVYIQNQGGTVSLSLLDIDTEIWEIYLRYNIQITAEYLPGKQNEEADTESRRKSSKQERLLPEEAWRHINNNWGERTISFLASRNNMRRPRFFSIIPDPVAEAINAFSQIWPSKGAYANPP